MADITSGRARRLFSVGSLTSAVGGSYLWQALKRPFQSDARAGDDLLATHIRNAERMVAGSTELRGAFMKLVQMLSMRTDLFPAEALDRLAIVQSNVPPMAWERVRSVLVEELGAAPEERFASFETEAFAAASLGQVHRAVLHDGTPVVVKIQYPGVGATVQQDLKNVRALVKALTTLVRDVMRQDFDREEVVRELEARLREELDYEHEIDNIERFRTLFASDRQVTIPRPYRELSSKRVLTMQRLEGYPLQDIMQPGVDEKLRRWVAEKLFRLLWRQVLEFGVLHADPHPGNYLVSHHPRIGLLDFGSVRIFEPQIRAGYLRLAHGLLARDDVEIGAACLTLGLAKGDPAPVVAMMHVICEPLERDAPYDPRSFDVMARGMQLTEIAVAHRVFHAPGHPVMLFRALMGLDGYLKNLGAVLNWHRIFADVVSAIPDPRKDPDAMKQLFALSAIGRDRPGIVADLAELIYECDCNLEDSRMTILGSEFAVLLLLSGQGADVEHRLSAGCKRLEWEKRLTVFFRPLDGGIPAPRDERELECVATGVDKAGIVARIARTLANHGANVADLRTELRPEPESGTPIYTMRLVMRLPADADETALRAQLERDAAELVVDLAVGERGKLPDDR